MFTFKKPKRAVPLEKAKGAKKAILEKLEAFLIVEEPQTIEWLVSFWDTQAAGVTYKELREAYLAGDLTMEQLDKWQKEYAKLVTDKLAPKWKKTMNAGAAEKAAQYPKFIYESSITAAQNYIAQNGAELVTNLVQEQRDALQAMIAKASGNEAAAADELARIMRPVIGLTKPQAIANQKLYESLKTTLLKNNAKMRAATAEKRAREAAARYAAKQHRYRAQCIARSELSKAYNTGGYIATQDAREKGYIGDCKKTWLTADNERVCEECSALDGESVNIDALFSNGELFPPAHPQCMCAVAYEEIGDTKTVN